MKLESLRKKSVADLEKQVVKLREEIQQARRDSALSNAEKNKFKIRYQKRDLSRILTVKKELEIAAKETNK